MSLQVLALIAWTMIALFLVTAGFAVAFHVRGLLEDRAFLRQRRRDDR